MTEGWVGVVNGLEVQLRPLPQKYKGDRALGFWAQAKILEVTIVSLVFVRMLEVVGYFTDNGDQDILSPDQEMVGELISVLIPIINLNTHPLHDVSSDNQNKTVCTAVYPVIAALFNHTCDPSLLRATWGYKLVVAAVRDIMVGEELTDMYTVHWTGYSTQERKDYLEVRSQDMKLK